MSTHHHPASNTNENNKQRLTPLPTAYCPLLTDPYHWAWPGWFPNGYLTILASEPGIGKSFLALRIAASFMDNRPWPDGAPFAAISIPTLKRAKNRLRVKSNKPPNQWTWELPPE